MRNVVSLLVRNIFGLIIVLCLYIVKPFKFVKVCLIIDSRMGHLATNTDLFLRRLQLKDKTKNRITYIGIASKPANQQLLNMFKRKFFIIQSTWARKIFRSFILSKSVFYEPLPYKHIEYYEYNNAKPNLSFTVSEEERGRKLLSKMGIGSNSWFVCFHARDSAYLSNQWNKSYNESIDFSYQDHYDCDIKNYLEAAKYIASLGKFAVRMGYGVAEKLPDLNNPQIIDYASDYRTDFGDIYLPAKCKFFLGSRTGLMFVPTIFHVPFACTNSIPLECNPFRKGDLFIPKRIWSIEKKRILTFREILETGAGYYLRNEQYKQAGLEAVENTAEEILDLAKEMNERLDGNFSSTEEDEELQNRFHSLFQPHHHCYGSPARIGAKFLRENKELLES